MQPRGMRITVNDVLGWLSHGMTEQEILDEHPGQGHQTVLAERGALVYDLLKPS